MVLPRIYEREIQKLKEQIKFYEAQIEGCNIRIKSFQDKLNEVH